MQPPSLRSCSQEENWSRTAAGKPSRLVGFVQHWDLGTMFLLNGETLRGPTSRVCTGARPPLCSGVWGGGSCISPGPFPLESWSREAPCSCSLREGRARSIPLCPELPWGAGEGAPWAPDISEGSDVLCFCAGRDGSRFSLELGATPAFGSRRYPCKCRSKAARACWWGDESI